LLTENTKAVLGLVSTQCTQRTQRNNRHCFYPCVLVVASLASAACKKYANAMRCMRCVRCGGVLAGRCVPGARRRVWQWKDVVLGCLPAGRRRAAVTASSRTARHVVSLTVNNVAQCQRHRCQRRCRHPLPATRSTPGNTATRTHLPRPSMQVGMFCLSVCLFVCACQCARSLKSLTR